MKFCHECGTKAIEFVKSIEKSDDYKPIYSSLERFAHYVSDFFTEDDDNDKPDEDEVYTNKESKQDLYNLLLNKHFLAAVILVLILLIVGVFFLISGENIENKSEYSINQLPVLKYNPETNNAVLIVKDKGFLRENEEFGEYVDLIAALEKGYDLPNKKEMGMVFENVPYFIDILIKDDMPNYEDQPYDAEIRTPLPVKKEIDSDYWVSDKFKLYPLKKARFVISYGYDEDFPYGAMNVIFFIPTKDI
jgi:hypothetical protein